MQYDADPPEVTAAIEAFQAGRQREVSFRLLWELYYREVRGFFLKRLGSLEDCLDLTQETFTRVYKGLKRYRGDSPFGAWVFTIARNLLRDHRTRGSSAKRLGHEIPLEAVADGLGGSRDEQEASLLDAERRRILREAIEKLPTQRYRCLVLWAYDGYTYEEIAVLMGLSIGTVKAHLAQAREQVKGLITAGSRSGR